MIKQSKSGQLRRRYLLLESKSKEDIEKTIQDYIGILGYSRALPVFVTDIDLPQNHFILAIERSSLNEIRASFEISNSKTKIIRVSGTIRGLKL